MVLITIPDAPCVEYYIWDILGVDVGKDSSTMEHLGMVHGAYKPTYHWGAHFVGKTMTRQNKYLDFKR